MAFAATDTADTLSHSDLPHAAKPCCGPLVNSEYNAIALTQGDNFGALPTR